MFRRQPARAKLVNELCRVTSQYVDFEDRIRLTGELEDGQRVILWLTRRLLDRLVPHLVGWLEQHEPVAPDAPVRSVARSSTYQSFEQEVAHHAFKPQPPVQARLGEPSWLVCTAELKSNPQVLRLTFKGRLALEQAQFHPGQRALRQWLKVIHGAYLAAGWPTHVWPTWMHENTSPQVGVPPAFH